jgi:hypothetical protein
MARLHFFLDTAGLKSQSDAVKGRLFACLRSERLEERRQLWNRLKLDQ